MMLLIVIIVGFLFLKNSSLSASLFGGAASGTAPYTIVPQGINVAPSGNTTQLQVTAASGINAGLGAAQAALKTASSSLATAIPIIGAAFSAISSALIQASAKRRQQAVSENQAVAAAIPGWDQAITQIANGYNNGSISAQQAIQLIEQQWALYWSEVSGVIQPNRNGCRSGTVTQPKGVSFCGGDYGAACCVGYDDLRNSSNNLEYALQQTDSTGKPAVASILPIFASKYGGTNRQGYIVTVTRLASIFSI